MKNILIIGATSAIAVACAKKWSNTDVTFYLVARNAERLKQVSEDLRVRGSSKVHTYNLDMNDFDKHLSMLDDCNSTLSCIDLVLVAHGTLPNQNECQADVNLAVKEFSTNALSVIAILTLLANKLESQGKGTIAIISSVAGDRGRQTNYLYGAAKAAVSTFSEGLRVRLFKSGVHVITIKPGFVDTPMTKDLNLPALLTSSPSRIAECIDKGILKKSDVIYTPYFWSVIMLIIRFIPGFIFKRLSL